jgi:WXG100 family type VII secretion target
MISVDPQEVVDAANKFDQKKADLETVARDIQSQIASMTSWQGKAQADFADVMHQWNQEVQNIHTVLDDVTRKLRQFEADISGLDQHTKF